MDKEDVLRFIRETGYRTKEQLHERFSSGNQEILDMTLESLMSEGNVKRIHFETGRSNGELYYCPYLG